MQYGLDPDDPDQIIQGAKTSREMLLEDKVRELEDRLEEIAH